MIVFHLPVYGFIFYYLWRNRLGDKSVYNALWLFTGVFFFNHLLFVRLSLTEFPRDEKIINIFGSIFPNTSAWSDHWVESWLYCQVLSIIFLFTYLGYSRIAQRYERYTRIPFGIAPVYLQLIPIVLVILSALPIFSSIGQIFILNISGYQVISGGGEAIEGYTLHSILFRFSIFAYIYALIVSRHQGKMLLVVYGVVTLSYAVILGQRNEIFLLLISTLLVFGPPRKSIQLLLIGVLSLAVLRAIEVARAPDEHVVTITSYLDIVSPLLGSESVSSASSIIAAVNAGEQSGYDFVGWFKSSVMPSVFDIERDESSYDVYKSIYFPFDERGYAISQFASLIYWGGYWYVVFYPIVLLGLFSVLLGVGRLLSGLRLGAHYAAANIMLVAYLILLSRNGLEGLRPIVLHLFLLFPVFHSLTLSVLTVTRVIKFGNRKTPNSIRDREFIARGGVEYRVRKQGS